MPYRGSYFVGAYATSPTHLPPAVFDKTSEEELLNKLSATKGICGLEVPIHKDGTIHKNDSEWFLSLLSRLNPSWKFVISDIPGVQENLKENPHFGIGSNDAAGRAQAVQFLNQVRDSVASLNEALGCQAVVAVEIHTAPKRIGHAASSREHLVESLQEIRSWDWCGAKLCIEHCDATVPQHEPGKGFMALDDEVEAVLQTTGTPTGFGVNWARSVLETRRTSGPAEHMKYIVSRNPDLLYGLMFSGTTGTQDELYGLWLDNHVPFQCSPHCQNSLMTDAAVEETLRACDFTKLLFLGVKLLPQPATLTVDQRVAIVEDGIACLDTCIERILASKQ